MRFKIGHIQRVLEIRNHIILWSTAEQNKLGNSVIKGVQVCWKFCDFQL